VVELKSKINRLKYKTPNQAKLPTTMTKVNFTALKIKLAVLNS